jgi:hypothetical protein
MSGGAHNKHARSRSASCAHVCQLQLCRRQSLSTSCSHSPKQQMPTPCVAQLPPLFVLCLQHSRVKRLECCAQGGCSVSSLVQSSSQLSQQLVVPQLICAARAEAGCKSAAELLQLTGGARHFTLTHTAWARALAGQPADQASEVAKGLKDSCFGCFQGVRVE